MVPETSNDEVESESEAEQSEDEPPQEDMCAGLFKGCVSKKLVNAEGGIHLLKSGYRQFAYSYALSPLRGLRWPYNLV